MAAITGSTLIDAIPNLGKKQIYVETPASADSADTVDVGALLDSVDLIVAFDQTTGDIVTATVSGTVITLDASGGTANHTYALMVIGA